MRLKPEKVEDLARQIAAALNNDKRVTLAAPAEDVEREVRKVFLADLQREDEVMEEVEQIIRAHRQKMVGKNIDMQVLRRKIRDQLVRERRIIL